MSDQSVNMNELTSDDAAKIPFPARQQLTGDNFKDARSGNGVADPKRKLLKEVKYHLKNDGAAKSSKTVESTDGGVTSVRHEGSGPDASQHAVPGRNDRTTGNDVVSAVPDGTVPDVLAWVGDNSARARLAMESEQSKPSPRTSLVLQLADKI